VVLANCQVREGGTGLMTADAAPAAVIATPRPDAGEDGEEPDPPAVVVPAGRPDQPADAPVDSPAPPPPDAGPVTAPDGRAPAPDARPPAPDVPPDTAPPDVPPPVAIRINVNGGSYTGIDHPGRWAADPGVGGVCGPLAYQNDAPIHGTQDGPLFAREMFGSPLVCAVGGGKLPPGKYRVNLYFAEIYWGPGCPGAGTGTGSRIFDIRLEGNLVLSNLDLFSEGGCAASTSGTGKPIVKRFSVSIDDGTLNLRLEAHRDNGKISAIEILSAF
jgi:hypothetical protein